MLFLLTGDSIAVGLSQYLYDAAKPAAIFAEDGISSQGGLARLRMLDQKRVVVSLGTNDDPRLASAFRHRVELALQGRTCVVWLTMPFHPRFNAVLRSVRAHDRRLKIVKTLDVHRGDGIHPNPPGYQLIAPRVLAQLNTCK